MSDQDKRQIKGAAAPGDFHPGGFPSLGSTPGGTPPPGDTTPNTGVVVKTRPRTKKPAMYKVLMLNDDYTPMEFVVHVLERFFQKNRDEATRIMLHVHRRGVGVCGVYHLRGRGNQGDAGDGSGSPEPAPAAMHDREGMIAPALPWCIIAWTGQGTMCPIEDCHPAERGARPEVPDANPD